MEKANGSSTSSEEGENPAVKAALYRGDEVADQLNQAAQWLWNIFHDRTAVKPALGPDSSFFLCQGRAKLNNGKSVTIATYRVVDTDGDDFWGYSFPVAGPTCGEAKKEGLTVCQYNVRYLYASARDSDGDRIMCEQLNEGSVNVGNTNQIPR